MLVILFTTIIIALFVIMLLMYGLVAGSAKSRTVEEIAFEMDEQEAYLAKMHSKEESK